MSQASDPLNKVFALASTAAAPNVGLPLTIACLAATPGDIKARCAVGSICHLDCAVLRNDSAVSGFLVVFEILLNRVRGLALAF